MGASFPWIFSKNYQHTGLRNVIKKGDVEKAIEVMKKAAEKMSNLPEIYETYKKEMEKLERTKPWKK